MALQFGKIRRTPGRDRRGAPRKGWVIDLGSTVKPRFLLSARGARFTTKQMAQAVLDAIRVKVARGADPQSAVDEFAPVSSERNGVELWAQRYVAHQRERCDAGELSPNTLRDFVRLAGPTGHWAWWFGRGLSEISAATLDEYASHLRGVGLGPKSVANVLGYFRSFLGHLRRLEVIDKIPVFPTVRVPEHLPTIVSARTQALILEEIPWERRGGFLACCHGVRPSEMRALEVGDAQEREGAVGLVISKAKKGARLSSPTRGTKTGVAAWIPIDDELARWVAWRLEQRDGPWRSRALFVNPNAYSANPEARWTVSSIRRAWESACARVGVEVALYEGTKHSSASSWFSSGATLPIIQRMLRHKDIRSTEVYAKLSTGGLIEAFRRHGSSSRRNHGTGPAENS